MTTNLDPQAISAAMAGFLACHVLTCRVLIEQGLVDKAKFAAFLERAMAEMTTGIEGRDFSLYNNTLR
jgi:hypothetical protein